MYSNGPASAGGIETTFTFAVPCSWTRMSPLASRFCSRTFVSAGGGGAAEAEPSSPRLTTKPRAMPTMRATTVAVVMMYRMVRLLLVATENGLNGPAAYSVHSTMMRARLNFGTVPLSISRPRMV
ncbi:MAG: hypothetical protein A2W34_07905 [Chloroflexi bacterium RBG_16_64_32]|nr:MAG: hypothetical protein A2W34_07905 [Chloroflexi bacterium RBG_16_64_32]